MPDDDERLRALDLALDAMTGGTDINQYFGRLGFDYFPENAAALLNELPLERL